MLVKGLHFHPSAVSEPDCNCFWINILIYNSGVLRWLECEFSPNRHWCKLTSSLPPVPGHTESSGHLAGLPTPSTQQAWSAPSQGGGSTTLQEILIDIRDIWYHQLLAFQTKWDSACDYLWKWNSIPPFLIFLSFLLLLLLVLGTMDNDNSDVSTNRVLVFMYVCIFGMDSFLSFVIACCLQAKLPLGNIKALLYSTLLYSTYTGTLAQTHTYSHTHTH